MLRLPWTPHPQRSLGSTLPGRALEHRTKIGRFIASLEGHTPQLLQESQAYQLAAFPLQPEENRLQHEHARAGRRPSRDWITDGRQQNH